MDGGRILCEHCGLLLKSRKSYNQHRNSKHHTKVTVLKCGFCQRPFGKSFNLRRHIRNIHSSDNFTDFTTGTMSREQLDEGQKPVYVTMLSEEYEDISSESDEELQNTGNDVKTDDAKPSTSKDTENMGGQLQIVESARTSQLREDRDNNNDNHEEEPSCSGTQNDGPSGASARTRGRVEVTSTINVLMQRRTVVYPDGFVDVSRSTNFTFSEDIDPTRVDCEDLLRDILSEMPLHFQNARREGGDQ